MSKIIYVKIQVKIDKEYKIIVTYNYKMNIKLGIEKNSKFFLTYRHKNDKI